MNNVLESDTFTVAVELPVLATVPIFDVNPEPQICKKNKIKYCGSCGSFIVSPECIHLFKVMELRRQKECITLLYLKLE